jgi:hypothetical protein
MFTRQLFAAAAMMAATCAAHADVISANTVSGVSGLASDMSIVDGNSSIGAAGNDLASLLAATNSNAQLYLVRGVEGLYMLASRTTQVAPDDGTTAITVPALDQVPSDTVTPVADVPAAADADPVLPVLDATDVPEPASLSLMLAGLLGATAFVRARKQG